MKYFTRLTLLTVCATFAFAQGFGGNSPDPARMIEMRVNMLARRLTLTDAQKAQATTIFTQAQAATTAPRTELKTVRTTISDAVKANNTAVIDQASIQYGTLTGQIFAAEQKAAAAFYAILTADQKTRFDSGPGEHGPGGGGRGNFGQMRNQLR